MSLLIDGKWHDHWYDTEKTGGWFVRNESVFRRQVSAAATSQFAAEFGGYHLYVSLACPWASRTVIYRKLKGLEPAISLSRARSLHEGPSARSTAAFRTQFLPPRYLYEIYIKADPRYTGRVTVPVLWDTTRHHSEY
jgi:putative glutathione S-transferase